MRTDEASGVEGAGRVEDGEGGAVTESNGERGKQEEDEELQREGERKEGEV